jgi:WD40 repeat protein
MKHAAWVIGLVVGVAGCNGTIGGDLHGGVGGSGSGGPSPEGGEAGWGNPTGSAGAGGSSLAGAGQGGAGDSPAGTGGINWGGGGGVPAGGAGWGGAFPAGGAFPTGGASPAGGQTGNPPEYEPASTCNSPVDAWIAFDSDAADFNRDLYVVRPDGSQLMRVTADPSIEKQPYFARTGNRLSFTSDRDGSPQIYVMDLSTFVVTQVTHRPEGADQSSFSADGQLLAFHSGASVYTINPDGTNEALIATGLGDFNAYFSPRFIGNEQLVFDRNNEIDAISVDKTNFRNVVGNWTVMIVAPTVSPLNNEIAYATECFPDEGFAIWTTPANVSSQVCSGRRITPAHDPLNNSRPAWGPANTFAYERANPSTGIGRITLINREPGSTPCSLTPATQDSRNPSWSAEGQAINFPTL